MPAETTYIVIKCKVGEYNGNPTRNSYKSHKEAVKEARADNIWYRRGVGSGRHYYFKTWTMTHHYG
jgi:hypothetical protein